MHIVHARLMKRSAYASSASLSRTLRTLLLPHDGIEHFHIADVGTEVEATFFVLLPTVEEAEAATFDVCTRVISWPTEDGNWVITHCMATIVPDMFILDEDKPDCPGG